MPALMSGELRYLHAMGSKNCCARLFLFSAAVLVASRCSAAAPPTGRLPALPEAFYPSRMAESIAGMVHGEVTSSGKAADGRAFPVAVKVLESFLGLYARGEVVAFSWQPDAPPTLAGDPEAAKEAGGAVCVFDRDRALLLVAYEDDPRTSALPGAIGTSRVPSSRYSKRELDWAWFAYQRHYGGLREYVREAWHKDRLPLGLMELHLRFAKPLHKHRLLDRLASGRRLSREELDVVAVCLRDVRPGVQARAAHILLDHSMPVDRALLWESVKRSMPADGAFGCLGALVRSGDAEAEEEIVRLLTEGKPSKALLEAAAWGRPDLLPLVASLKNTATTGYVWLKLGGTAEELLELHGESVLKRRCLEFERSGTVAGLRLILQRIELGLDGRIPRWHIGYGNDILGLGRLVKKLKGSNAPGLRDALQPALRTIIERAEAQKHQLSAVRPDLLAILASFGDREALAELGARSWDDQRGGRTLRFVADFLSDVHGKEATETLVSMLVRAEKGWRHDDTFQKWTTMSHIGKILHKRDEADRQLALSILPEATVGNESTRTGEAALLLFYVRWMLGDDPTPAELLRLEALEPGYAYYVEELGLKIGRGEYASILPELRQNPRKHATTLALLKDEAFIAAFEKWVADAILEGEPARLPVSSLTVRLSASQLLAPAMHRLARTRTNIDASHFGRERSFYAALGETEAPSDLTELAAWCTHDNKAFVALASYAFLIALGRRPDHEERKAE